MKIYAVVRDGIVENTIGWDGNTGGIVPHGCEAVEITEHTGGATIGSIWSGGKFTPQPDEEE